MRTDQSCGDGARLWLALAMLLGIAVAVSIWQTPQRINHDCANYFHTAEMVLDGAIPYCTAVDVNPPLSTYLHIPIVWLARTLGISPIIVFQVCVTVLLFVTAVEMLFLLRKRESKMRPAEQGLVLFAWMALFLLIDWRGDVGQREHLFVLTYVPYLFLRILRYHRGSVPIWFAVLLGLQAGVGVSLKPYFLLDAVAVEMALMLASRRWRTVLRPECMALAGVVTAYVAHWLFVPAAMREGFFCRWVPLIRAGYRAYDASYAEIAEQTLRSPFTAAGLVGVLAAVLLLSTRRRLRLRLHVLALATLAIASIAMLFVQHKGYTYHYIPIDIAALLCLLIVGLSAAKRERAANVNASMAASTATVPGRSLRAAWGTIAIRSVLVAVVGGLLAVWFVGRPGSARPDTPEYAALRRVVAEHTHPGDRVLMLATSTRPAYPMLVQLGCRPSSRYTGAMQFAFLYFGAHSTGDRPIYHRYDEASAEERRSLDEFRDDVKQYQPRLIVINDTPGWFGLPKEFNLFEYFVYCGWTKQSLKGYREVPAPKGWKVFERQSSPADIAANGR